MVMTMISVVMTTCMECHSGDDNDKRGNDNVEYHSGDNNNEHGDNDDKHGDEKDGHGDNMYHGALMNR